MNKPINSFPGYEFVRGEDGKEHNMYRGVDLGKGGYVYAQWGMYRNVALLDAASMHPTSIILLNKLGEYTQRYADLRAARIFIKHRDYESAGKLFDGKLKPYLTSDDEADALSKALKLPLNAFFGCSFSAQNKFPAYDIRDKNNIIALRGALFMKTLQDEVVRKGYRVVHIKTDSIKIADATPEIIQFVMDFGKKYGYEMEHEATYDRMCLVNDAVYIAKYDDKGIRNKGGKHAGEWTATGTQFAVPYVFKTLFSKEEITFDDLCETRSVSKGNIYLDMNEKLSDVSAQEKELSKIIKLIGPIDQFDDEQIIKMGDGLQSQIIDAKNLQRQIEKGHDYQFIGRVGLFCPIKPGCGGGILYRENDGKYYAVTGTSGYRWLEAEMVKTLGKEQDIDISYYENLAEEARKAISQYGDFDNFVNADPNAWWPDAEEFPF